MTAQGRAEARGAEDPPRSHPTKLMRTTKSGAQPQPKKRRSSPPPQDPAAPERDDPATTVLRPPVAPFSEATGLARSPHRQLYGVRHRIRGRGTPALQPTRFNVDRWGTQKTLLFSPHWCVCTKAPSRNQPRPRHTHQREEKSGSGEWNNPHPPTREEVCSRKNSLASARSIAGGAGPRTRTRLRSVLREQAAAPTEKRCP